MHRPLEDPYAAKVRGGEMGYDDKVFSISNKLHHIIVETMLEMGHDNKSLQHQ